MTVYLTRDSVCAGDDGDAPHARTIEVPDGLAVDEWLRQVIRQSSLPGIDGGRATWSLSSNVPLAVIAQQWSEARFLRVPPLAAMDVVAGVWRLHFSYHVQDDPDLVFNVLKRLTLRAQESR